MKGGSTLEQSTFIPNARSNARDWRGDEVDLVLVRSQLDEIDLARRSYGLRLERIPLLRLRVEPDDDLRLWLDVQGGLPLELHAEEDGLEGAAAVRELAAESDLDGGLLAEDAYDIGAGGGLSCVFC
jgi:hypothetical protein